MDFDLFHFGNPEWLYGMLLIPAIWILCGLVKPKNSKAHNRSLERFVDKHLLPHIIVNNNGGNDKGSKSFSISLILWSLIWCLLMLAMAGPRWSYREFKTFQPEQKLVILLDLSQSMEADDIKPSRISRARLEIEEIMRVNPQLNIGLVAFAAHAHMISPVTRDHDNIKHLLPLLGSDLVSVQGSRLSPALKMASDMLFTKNVKAVNSSIIILSDGGFQDNQAFRVIKELATKGIIINTIGVGTTGGVHFVDNSGKALMNKGTPVISKLNEEKMQEISKLGKGLYFPTHYSDRNAIAINNILSKQNKQFLESQYTTQHWEERFYIFILPILAIIIFWFRKGFIFPFILATILFPTTSHASDNLRDLSSRLLLNDQNFAKKLVEEDDSPKKALDYLEDPYRRGIAYYHSGNYDKAAREFEKNKRTEVAKESLYNLGNSLAMQHKLHEAIDAYKSAIELDNDYEDAKYNLAIIEKMIQEKQQQEKDNKKEEDQDHDQEDNNQQDTKKDPSDAKKSDDNSGGENNQEGDKQKQDENKNDNQSDDENGHDDTSDNEPESKISDKQEDSSPEDDQKKNNDSSESGDEAQDEKPQEQNEDGDKQKDDIDIDEWLNKISDDHKNFLRNQFYLESQRQMKLEKLDDNLDPW